MKQTLPSSLSMRTLDSLESDPKQAKVGGGATADGWLGRRGGGEGQIEDKTWTPTRYMLQV